MEDDVVIVAATRTAVGKFGGSLYERNKTRGAWQSAH